MSTVQSRKCTPWGSLFSEPHDHPRFTHEATEPWSSRDMPSVAQLVGGEPHLNPDPASLTHHTLPTKPCCLVREPAATWPGDDALTKEMQGLSGFQVTVPHPLAGHKINEGNSQAVIFVCELLI